MATTTPISVEEYLRSTYEPDAEYVDGVIEERPMGENRHSEWEATLSFFFKTHRRAWNIRVRPEYRTKTGERHFRVPDLALTDAALLDEPIATAPPLLAIEILNPEDRLSRLIVRLADFQAMGVPAIYIIDPADNSLLRFKAGKLEVVDSMQLRDVEIPFADVSAELD